MRKACAAASASLAMLVPVASAGAATPVDGTFRGQTGQGLKFVLKVADERIKSFDFLVSNDCGASRKPIEVGGGDGVKVDRRGAFRLRLGNASGSLVISGRFTKPRRVVGRFREKAAGAGRDEQCDTGSVSYTARKR